MMQSNPPSNPQRSRGAIYITILIVVGLWTYRNALLASFVLDDVTCIVQNRGLEGWQISGPAVPTGVARRPMGQLSLAANVHLLGRGPVGFHAVNIVIHLAAALLLYGLVRRVLELPEISPRLAAHSRELAFASALLWLLHPLNTMAVTYAIQRLESQMGMCYLLCLYALVRGSQVERAWPWYVLSSIAFGIGVGSKEVMITALAVAPLVDRVYLSKSWSEVVRRRGVLYGSFCVLAIGWGVFVVSVQGERHEVPGINTVGTGWEYLRTQPEVILHYLRLAVWPDVLCFDYWWPIASVPAAIYGNGAILMVIILAIIAGIFLAPRVALPALIGFLILSPSSSIVPLPDLADEYRMYLTLACFCVVAVIGIDQLIERCIPSPSPRNAVRLLLLALAAVGLSLRTYDRNRDYGDPVAFWKLATDQAPHNPRAHYNLGRHMEQRVQEKPELEEKYRKEILASYRQAIAVQSNYVLAHASLASALGHNGQFDAAIAEFEEALKLAPNRAQTIDNYGNLLSRAKRYDEALARYKNAIEVSPGYLPTYSHMAAALSDLGRYKEAMLFLRESLRRDPRQPGTTRELAWLLATADDVVARNGAEAVQLALRLQKMTPPSDFAAADAVAAAYAENKDFDQAIAAAERARDQASAKGQMKAAEEIGARLELYRNGQPYRQSRAEKSAPPVNPAAAETITPQGSSGLTPAYLCSAALLPANPTMHETDRARDLLARQRRASV